MKRYLATNNEGISFEIVKSPYELDDVQINDIIQRSYFRNPNEEEDVYKAYPDWETLSDTKSEEPKFTYLITNDDVKFYMLDTDRQMDEIDMDEVAARMLGLDKNRTAFWLHTQFDQSNIIRDLSGSVTEQ